MSRCEPASRTRIRAYREGVHVLLIAEGEIPTPGFTITITPSPLRIFPQQFDLQRCAKPGIFPQHVTPYRHLETVRYPEDQPQITVHHADGTDQIPIEPCGTDLAGYAAAVRGSAEKAAPPAADEAVGMSPTLSFDDAFAKAIANLPAVDAPHADALTHIQVLETSGLFGGFAGFHHLLVRVSRTIT
ncbi:MULTISPECIES: hypothetical protein [unclassified Frankia]|uniref:hypothetical protein n=1 Tax=unclassified Frankia TaxID=2632575 RepID=UPI001EF43D67|nr:MULTISPECIES: hypothetical protein [unclassified Frankia]